MVQDVLYACLANLDLYRTSCCGLSNKCGGESISIKISWFLWYHSPPYVLARRLVTSLHYVTFIYGILFVIFKGFLMITCIFIWFHTHTWKWFIFYLFRFTDFMSVYSQIRSQKLQESLQGYVHTLCSVYSSLSI